MTSHAVLLSHMLQKLFSEPGGRCTFWIHTPFLCFFSLFQVKKKQNCGMWTILIRLKGQGGNHLTRLGLVSRLPQVSQVQRVETGGRKGKYIEKEAGRHSAILVRPFTFAQCRFLPRFLVFLIPSFDFSHSSVSSCRSLSPLSNPSRTLGFVNSGFFICLPCLNVFLLWVVNKGPLTARQSLKFPVC